MMVIDYIEFWATKHCNLNCKGCSSCSPIAEEWYLDSLVLERDLKRLQELKLSISNIAILGGEPLLHPNLTMLFEVVKSVYPESNLSMLTNGILLKQMNDYFWEKCAEYAVKLKVTCFPVVEDEYITDIESLMKKWGIKYHLTKKVMFNKILVENNQYPLEDIIGACGCNHAYNLYNGFVSRCTVPMITELFNETFGTKLNTDGRLNIYESTADEIINFLSVPNDSCRNCSANPQKVRWERCNGKPIKEDWVIEE